MLLAAIAAAVIVCAAAVFAALHPLGFAFALGIRPAPAGTAWTYQLWSGFIPALTVLSLVTLLVGAWRHVVCHQDHCWRIGKHKISGSPWCNRHHESARPEQTTDDLIRELCGRIDTLTGEIRDARPAPRPPARSRSKSATAP